MSPLGFGLSFIGWAAAAAFAFRAIRADGDWRPYPWTKEVGYDTNGKEVGHRWIKETLPVMYSRNGLSHLGSYVSRFVAFEGHDCSIIASTFDGKKAVSVIKMDGADTIGMFFDLRRDRLKETAARKYFSSRRYPIQDDYVAQLGTQRIIDWVLPNKKGPVLNTLLHVAMSFEGISPDDGLSIRYEANKNAPPSVPGASRYSFFTAESVSKKR